MNRLFGAKSTVPKATLDDEITSVESSKGPLIVQIKAATEELKAYSAKLNRMPDGPGKRKVRDQAQKVLNRRRIHQRQLDQLEVRGDNMVAVKNMGDNMQNVMTTVNVLKQTNKSLRQQYGKIDIDKIERMQDEMADLMEMGNEIQDSISRSYDVPENVDEAELDAELEALGDEMEMGYGETETPNFMVDEVPQFIDEAPSTGDKVQEPAR